LGTEADILSNKYLPLQGHEIDQALFTSPAQDGKIFGSVNQRLVNCAAIAPYLVWMVLMTALPATAAAYALRTACAAAALAFSCAILRPAVLPRPRAVVWGALTGLAVLVLWIAPEQWSWYRAYLTLGGTLNGPSPYDPAVCGWPLTLTRLAGSAVIIAAAEELFFRGFLYRWLQNRDWRAVDPRRFDLSAFLWTTALFALEHDRWFAGALAGALYSFVARRHGLGAAILAHCVTNFALGLYVIFRGEWGFW
jgi:CAAX prenyl protease-like protein